MKRKATALFLLVITAIFTARPVIAMHYCMGELRSFNLYHHETAAPCHDHVMEPRVENTSDAGTGHDTACTCCPETRSPARYTYTPFADKCCDNTLLELSTDDYQGKTELSISRVILNPVTEGMMLLGNVLNPPVPETGRFPSTREFPPEGLFLKDICILTYICTFRI